MIDSKQQPNEEAVSLLDIDVRIMQFDRAWHAGAAPSIETAVSCVRGDRHSDSARVTDRADRRRPGVPLAADRLLVAFVSFGETHNDYVQTLSRNNDARLEETLSLLDARVSAPMLNSGRDYLNL